MKEYDIIDDINVRNKLISHLEVLDKVKAIPYFPEELFVGVNQASYYYETSTDAIKAVLLRNTEEFAEDGVRSISGEELKKYQKLTKAEDILDSTGSPFIGNKCRKYIIIPKRALLRIGMFLKRSEVAKQVRDYLLDIEKEQAVCIADLAIKEIDSVEDKLKIKTLKKINNNKLLIDKIKTNIEKCKQYGIDIEDSRVIIQEAIVNRKSIDVAILEKLKELEEMEYEKKKGILRERIEYIAENYYDNDYSFAYHEILNRLKYVIGRDLEKEQKRSKKSGNYLDKILQYNAYEEALKIISEITDPTALEDNNKDFNTITIEGPATIEPF